MMGKKDYDLLVIGAGSAGITPALECVKAGWKVGVIDSRSYGGTCPLRGCNPKKVLVGAAEAVERIRRMLGRGISNKSTIDWPDLIRFKRTFTEPVPQNTERLLKEKGVDTFHGTARFTGPNTLSIDGRSLSSEHILIATGGKPRSLGIPGEEYLTISDEFLETDNLPQAVTFIGGGYVSMEFAHVAARAGRKVTIIERSSRILKGFDPDLVGMLLKVTEEIGIEVYFDMPVGAIEKKGEKLLIHAGNRGGRVFESDMVVHGAGRVPDIDQLDLDKANIEAGKRGIQVNEYMQSVSNPSVYAAGDVAAAGLPLTPVASMEGEVVSRNLLHRNSVKADHSVIPSVVFTIPPLASVGMREDEAKEKGFDYTTNFQDTSSWFSSRFINLKHSGFKLLIENGGGRILGAHILGHHADEVINVFSLAIKMSISADDLKHVIWAYPTSSHDIAYMI